MAESAEDEDLTQQENEYSSDEFEYDEVIETEAFIQYNAAIGPNIIVSKTNSNKRTPTPRYAASAVKRAISQRPGLRTRNGTPASARRSQTFVKKPGKNPPRGGGGQLRNEFQKLSLGVDLTVFPGSRGPTPSTAMGRSGNISNLQMTGSRSSLAIKAPPKKRQENFVQQRLNSARKIQMKDMMSQFRLLENANYTLSVENRTLRTVQHRHEIALRKYEGLESDFPKLLEHHANEVHSLQRGFRKAQGQARQYEEKIRGLTLKALNLEKEKNRLQTLVGLNQLEERHTLLKQVQQIQQELAEAEKKGAEYRRRFELLEKTQKKHLSEMRGKLRASNNRLFEAETEIDRQRDVLRQKDKVINYLRMRSSRHTEFEPPIVRKMSEADMSKYTTLLLQNNASQKQQQPIECEEPRNPPSRSHYPPQLRTQIPKMQFSNRGRVQEQHEPEPVPVPRPRRIPRLQDMHREEDDNYSVAGSGPSDLHSLSSCDSRAQQLDTVRSGGDRDLSHGSMSPSYSEENLESWTQMKYEQKQYYGGRGDETYTEEESDRFEVDSESGRGYFMDYPDRVPSRVYSTSDINTLRGCDSEHILPARMAPTPRNVDYSDQIEPEPNKHRPEPVPQPQTNNDVPQEGQIMEAQEMKPTEEICPNDGGGDASGLGIQDMEMSSYASDAEFGFCHQSNYEHYSQQQQHTAREMSSSGSSTSAAFMEEPGTQSDAQNYERDFSTAVDETEADESGQRGTEYYSEEDEDDKVMNRILEAVLERSEMLEQHARLNEQLQMENQQAQFNEQRKLAEEQAQLNEQLKKAEEQAQLKDQLNKTEQQKRLNEKLKMADQEAHLNQRIKMMDQEFRVKEQLQIAKHQAQLNKQLKIAEQQAQLKEQLKLAEQKAQARLNEEVADEVVPETQPVPEPVPEVVTRTQRGEYYPVIRTPAMEYPENPVQNKFTTSTNVAKARAFALSSPFYTFCNKLSSLDQREGPPAAEYKKPGPVPSPRIDPAVEKLSEMDDEKFQETLKEYSKPKPKTPVQLPEISEKKPEIPKSKFLDNIWKVPTGPGISEEEKPKPGSSTGAHSLLTHQPRNGLMRDNKDFANTTPTGNMPLSRDQKDASAAAARRFKSNWE